ncbi:MAG TPA: SusC/RagA family TonB-linked outer membrane protein [Prolixibacteraceae bacterium]|nr:SusC/RagA family TonB-linked outer membrane protein [Prolixibacteraceae bacterium]
MACISIQSTWAQTPGISVKGIVLESGTGQPLKQVSISVAATGTSSETDESGAFTIVVPNKNAELLINLPGYNKRNVYLNGRDLIHISLVPENFSSFDNSYNHPLGSSLLKDAGFAVSAINAENIKFGKATTFDQALQGRVSGLSVTQQSGMPGSKTYMNIRGISSLYGNSEPLLFIDGMIHDYTYATQSLMEGFSINPLEVVDIEDISDISVIKDGTGYLGAAGSNGVINVNTEQKSETSTVIKMSAYGGMSMVPQSLDLMDASQFRGYFSDMLTSRGITDIDTRYPWLNGGPTANEYYRYNNNTNWQESSFKPSSLQKYHFFLKGGDDIATYNISTGYSKQQGLFEDSYYSRFNLRINGKINISNKFSIAPNAKLSLGDSKLPNLGYSTWKNPLTASILMPPLAGEYARDNATGIQLPYLDDVTAFNVSNPASLIKTSMGLNRNYHFLSSVMAQYKFNNHFTLSNLMGINFNNSRESIFLPDLGVVQVDSAANSPGDFVNEFRSSQNHATLAFNTKSASGHSIVMQGGMRYMKNTYKYNKAISLNTPSDDFKSVQQGSKYGYLRTSTGDDRPLIWVSYFGSANYNFRDKYLLDANISYDGNSLLNKKNRYNYYPSLAAAWRVSSERFLSGAKWLDELKVRGSWSQSGNMFSNVYDFSKLFYTSQRVNGMGVIVREAIPNENLELEMKETMNAGVDISLFRQSVNFHVDYYQSAVNNLIIQQTLPQTFGYTTYYDNGGKLESSGLEFSGDIRLQAGSFVWTLGGSVTQQRTEVKSLEFLNPATSNVVTPIEGMDPLKGGGHYITSEGKSVNAFWGYRTEGIFNDGTASQYIGPNRVSMAEGDIKFADMDGNKIINDADKTIIGNPNPDLFGGINTSLSFGRLELAAFFNYSLGNDIFNYVRYKAESMDSYANQMVSVLDRWTPANPSNTMPRASFGDPTGNTAFSDRWIEDGSYVRLKQLTLNYTLPQGAGFYKGLTLYVTGTNLLTFTDYSGYDPDFLYSNNPFYMGIDYGKMPQPKSFIVGLKLNL